MKFLNIDFTWQFCILVLFLIGLLALFLRDFKLHQPRSWLMLFTILGLGGFVLFEKWRRDQLMKEFQERESILKSQEDELLKLKEASKITELAYQAALDSLAKEKLEAQRAVLALEAQLSKKVEERSMEYHNMSDEDVMSKFERLTGGKK